MKKIDPDRPILIPPSSQPVQRLPMPRRSVPELSKSPLPQQPKTRNWKQRIHNAAMPIAGITTAIVTSSVEAQAAQPPVLSAPAHPSPPMHLGTLGQHPNLSQPDLERFIRSTDLRDVMIEASPGLPIENASDPKHPGGTGGPETSEGWIHHIGEFLKDEAGDIAKHLLNEPIEDLIKVYIISRYAPGAVKALYSKQEEKRTTIPGYTPSRTSDARALPGFRPVPTHPGIETLLKLNQVRSSSTEGGNQSASSAAPDFQTDVAKPGLTRQAESIRALKKENRSLRRQIARLKNINQAKKKSG